MKAVQVLDLGGVANVKGPILEIDGGENAGALVQGAGGVGLGGRDPETEQKKNESSQK